MLEKIFSVQKSEDRTIVKIFGIKMKFRKSLAYRVKQLEYENKILSCRIENLPYELVGANTLKNISMPNVRNVEDTLNRISNESVSISRFGDGELELMFLDKSLPFQRFDEGLKSRLFEVLKSDLSDFLVCIPNTWGDMSCLRGDIYKFWVEKVVELRPFMNIHLDFSKEYYDTSVTRCISEGVYNKFKTFFANRTIIIVEGEKTRFGVGNDLLDKARSIKRILCPAKNAFDKYNQILEACKSLRGGGATGFQDPQTLFLIALGPTATVLAYDLHKLGYRAIDIGHLDICYEWFLRKAENKIKIPGKYVNEVSGGDVVEDCTDKDYLSQIICRV